MVDLLNYTNVTINIKHCMNLFNCGTGICITVTNMLSIQTIIRFDFKVPRFH